MIRKSLSATTREATFNYEDYKRQVVFDDCNELEKFAKTIRWWWWIPIFGFIFYTAAMQIAFSGIDRGTLRREFVKRVVNWSLMTLFIAPVIIIYISFAVNIYSLIIAKIMKVSIVSARGIAREGSDNKHPAK